MKYKLKKFFIRIPLTVLLIIGSLTLHANRGIQGDGKSDENKPTDKDITSFIQMEFIVQDGVNWNDIDVETANGIVTLSGTVDNILARDRSINVAKAIKGVRGVINDISVRSYDVSDFELRKNVESALLLDPATESYEVNVKANDGKVSLSGKVDSWQEKQLAEKVAKGVKGVESIENNIYFDYDKTRSDPEIKNDIVQTLRWDIRVDDGLIDVKVKNGEVSLRGTVGSVSEHSQTIVDSWVAGVKDVDASELIISDWARDEEMRKDKYVFKTDEAIEKAVKDAFLYDPRVLSFNPEVDVQNGRVILTGVVNNLRAKKAAEIDAKNVVGVWKVENLLKVRGEKDLATDLSIQTKVNQALALNPFLDGYDVDVMVDNGVVTLDGYVENYHEKYKAQDIASTIYGVKEIKNKLNVAFEALPYAYDYNNWYYYPYSRNPAFLPTPTRSDWEIENNIESQIWWSPFVNLSDVSVEVDNGIAILEGTVDTWNEYHMAEKNAFDGGALGVDNDLDVKTSQ